MWYVASMLRHCTASSYPDQAACVKQVRFFSLLLGLIWCDLFLGILF